MSDETDVTDNGATPGPVSLEDRLDVLEAAVGTSNRIARRTMDEVAYLRWTVLFALVYMGALYVKVGR